MTQEKSETKLNSKGNKRGMHPNSQKNIVGQRSGGRPPNELSITVKQREMLPLPCPYAPGKTWLEWLADRGMALAGENAGYYRELMDRLEGKVTQPIATDGELIIKVVYDDDNKGSATQS